MKKIKKILAMVMAMAMVLGMSLTTFAAEPAYDEVQKDVKDATTYLENTSKAYAGTIEIKGLASGDKTTLNLYQVIGLNSDTNEWMVADWATDYVNTENNPYEITEPEELAKAAASSNLIATVYTNATDFKFMNVPVGAYVIVAAGDKATYSTMVVNNYNTTAPDTVVTNEVDATAKTSGYTVDKAAKVGDKFIARGEEVEFTVTTTFPSFPDPTATDNSFKIVDEPTGLDITEVTSVKVGSTVLVKDTHYTVDEEMKEAPYATDTKSYTIDLTKYISGNTHAGKVVTIEYKAIVTAADGYQNTVNSSRNDVEVGAGSEGGFTGDITITKYDAIQNAGVDVMLDGAQFTVTKVKNADDTDIIDTEQEEILFVQEQVGVYRKALNAQEVGSDGKVASSTIEATNGTVQVKGLDGGTYHFTETKAPDGYAINENGVDVKIDEKEAEVDGVVSKNVSAEDSIKDSKLSALPSTGGIGTTIFTIGGVAIMVVAAGLFFATRKKASK